MYKLCVYWTILFHKNVHFEKYFFIKFIIKYYRFLYTTFFNIYTINI